jgi:hypothetical protein
LVNVLLYTLNDNYYAKRSKAVLRRYLKKYMSKGMLSLAYKLLF